MDAAQLRRIADRHVLPLLCNLYPPLSTLQSRPPPPSILLKVAAYIPHAGAQLLLRTLASYLPLLDAFLNDVAVVIFCIGCAVMYAAWKVGLDPLLAPTDGASVAGAAAGAVAGGDAPVLPGFGNGFGGPPPPPM